MNVENLILPSGGLAVNLTDSLILVEAIAAGVPFYIDGEIGANQDDRNIRFYSVNNVLLQGGLHV